MRAILYISFTIFIFVGTSIVAQQSWAEVSKMALNENTNIHATQTIQEQCLIKRCNVLHPVEASTNEHTQHQHVHLSTMAKNHPTIILKWTLR